METGTGPLGLTLHRLGPGFLRVPGLFGASVPVWQGHSSTKFGGRSL